MQVKTIISAIAISFTMGVAGPVFAQTTINGTVISADDLPKVQARCDEITGAPRSVSDEMSNNGEATDDPNTPSDDTKDDAANAEAATTASTTFDLDSLDAASCAQLTAK